MVNNHGFIIYKANHKKGRRHDYDVYKNNHPVTPKQVVNVLDLGYLGIERIFQNNYPPYRIKRKETVSYMQRKKKITINIILKRE